MDTVDPGEPGETAPEDTGEVDVTVPAGTFSTLKINRGAEGSETWYDRDVGMISNACLVLTAWSL